MKKNNLSKFYTLKVLVIVSIIAIVIFVISNILINKKISVLLDEKYTTANENLKNQAKLCIQNKQDGTLFIALALSKNRDIITALQTNNPKLIKLKEFSHFLKKTTKFKNVWFHIVDKNGISFFKSWTSKRGESILKIRLDVVKMLKEPKIMTTISVGKFDMTFKSMVPMYDNDKKFIGIFEIITHFNSISKKLEKSGTDSLIVVDKKYKKQLTKAIGKTFIDDYYIANLNYKPQVLDYIKEKGIDYYINNDKYTIDKKRNIFITKYTILDINGNNMGYILMYKSLKLFNFQDIAYVKQNNLFYIFLVILFIFALGYYLVNRKHAKELDDKVAQRTKELHNSKLKIEDKNKILKNNLQGFEDLINSTIEAIIVSENKLCIDINKETLNLFGYKSKDEVIGISILDFISDESKDLVLKKMKMKMNAEPYESIMRKADGTTFPALIRGQETQFNGKKVRISTAIDLSELKKKDKLLFEQSKLASMGEMIGNIAHQWRQPLSVISTASTGMQLQKEYNMLTDDIFNNSCNAINENAQYLSKTIDDFRNFIKGDRTKKVFSLEENIDSFVNLIHGSAKNNNINILFDLEKDIQINGYENELIQCLINIFNNAKDALKANITNNEERLLFISSSTNQDQAIIKIKDNAGGIQKDIIDKIFEPYFTTKHQLQGTGLGLHMTYNLIVDGMDGTIEATNVTFSYKNESYVGAQFSISLPIS